MCSEILAFNEDDNIKMPLTEVGEDKKNISNYNLARRYLVKYFASNDLDPAIINHLYGVVFNYVEDFSDRIPSIRELIKTYNYKYQEKDFDLNYMFSGVNKSLTCPLMVLKGVSFKRAAIKTDQSLDNNLSYTAAVGYHPDEVLRFNPKNIVKLLDYPINDAKALFRNFNLVEQELYLPKVQRLDGRIHAVGICHFSESAMHCWHIDELMVIKKISEGLIDENAIPDLLEKFFKGVPLPITNLKLWRLITKEWYEREKGWQWNKLSSRAQKRHLVNMIRHGSIGYSQCYTNLPSYLVNLLHEAAFNCIMRKIANTFPFLRNECQTQWNYREKNNLLWSCMKY